MGRVITGDFVGKQHINTKPKVITESNEVLIEHLDFVQFDLPHTAA